MCSEQESVGLPKSRSNQPQIIFCYLFEILYFMGQKPQDTYSARMHIQQQAVGSAGLSYTLLVIQGNSTSVYWL